MNTDITLGKTGITVNKNGFGALPIQRIGREEAAGLLRKAYDSGIRFFDTARFYTDSEEKIGYALKSVRPDIILATKTMAKNAEDFWADLNKSLQMLQTSTIDIYQFHNPPFCPKPGDGSGLYEAMLEAREKGMVRHIGITNHRLAVAMEAADSGLYDTIQFPLSYLSTEGEIQLIKGCRENGIGIIAMKALAGGLITNSAAAYAFLAQYDGLLPIWGIQREEELGQFISYISKPPEMNEEISAIIEEDRKALSNEFCRGCGYCLPCPSGIDIQNAARMSLMIRRAPASVYFSDEWKIKMKKVEECIHCDHCKSHCPYGLDTPGLLEENWADYREFI